MIDIGNLKRETAEAFADPQPGDRFSEMFSWWMVVVAVHPDGAVDVLTLSPPGTLPDDGTLRRYPDGDTYRNAYRYPSSPNLGYTVMLTQRHGPGWVEGWLDRALELAAAVAPEAPAPETLTPRPQPTKCPTCHGRGSLL